MRIVIDHLEERDAICEKEDGELCRIPRILLPKDVRDGDILKNDGDVYILLENETAKQQKRVSGKLAALLKK